MGAFRTTYCLVGIQLIASLGMGCRGKKQELKLSQTSAYQTDFTVVYNEAISEVTKLYPNLEDQPTTGVIRTAWHPLRIRNSGHGTDPGLGSQARSNIGNTNTPVSINQQGQQQGFTSATQDERRYYFVRFNVAVVGRKPPYRVRVDGEASAWRTGQVPTPLRGGEVPTWLGPRIDTLRLNIYRRLRQHAVPLEVETKAVAKRQVIDVKGLGALQDDSAKVLAHLRRYAQERNAMGLKNHLASTVVWSETESGNADLALALWQADPGYFEKLSRLIGDACSQDETNLVVCKNNEASLKLVADASGWLLSEFVVEP